MLNEYFIYARTVTNLNRIQKHGNVLFGVYGVNCVINANITRRRADQNYTYFNPIRYLYFYIMYICLWLVLTFAYLYISLWNTQFSLMTAMYLWINSLSIHQIPQILLPSAMSVGIIMLRKVWHFQLHKWFFIPLWKSSFSSRIFWKSLGQGWSLLF